VQETRGENHHQDRRRQDPGRGHAQERQSQGGRGLVHQRLDFLVAALLPVFRKHRHKGL
jgi:hypothetical protein